MFNLDDLTSIPVLDKIISKHKKNQSKPFQKTNLKIQNPEESAKYLIKIINSIDQSQTGKFFNWDGSEIAW